MKLTELDVLKNTYDKFYTGRGRTIFPHKFFEGCEKQKKEKVTIELIKYVISTYLEWTPQQVKTSLTIGVLKKLKLLQSIKRFIQIPKDYDTDEHFVDFLLGRMYPCDNIVDMPTECVMMYEMIQSGERSHFPSSWMSTVEGTKRLSVILDYMLSTMPTFRDKADLYNFIFSPLATRLLQEKKVYYYGNKLFDSSPSIYHNGMPKALRSDFHYAFHLWCAKNKISHPNIYREERKKQLVKDEILDMFPERKNDGNSGKV